MPRSASWQQSLVLAEISDRALLEVVTPASNRLQGIALVLDRALVIIQTLLKLRVSTLVTVRLLGPDSKAVYVPVSIRLMLLRPLLSKCICLIGESLTKLFSEACTIAQPIAPCARVSIVSI